MAKTQSNHRYTVEEYMALEKASERQYEYRDGEIVCMSGGTLNHYRYAFKDIQKLSAKTQNDKKHIKHVILIRWITLK